jgi:hypothetical protein
VSLTNTIVWIVIAIALAIIVNTPSNKLLMCLFAGVGIAYCCMSARDMIEKAFLS